MKYQRVWRMVAETPWAIVPEKLAAIMEVLELRASGERFTDEQIAARIGAAAGRPGQRVSGSIAVLPIVGTISQRVGMFSDISGGASTEAIGAAFKQLVADPSIGAIVLEVDSPGGGVYGVGELAETIYRARSDKPIVAVANSLAASAAYWLASAAGELVVTPGGEVGSIGVFAVHEDQSALDERLGLKTSLISAGKYKVEGNPFEPLGEEARGYMQSRVDEYYGLFTAAVAKQRGRSAAEVREGFGEGRVVGAKQAVRLGMADRVATLDETIARLAGSKSRGSARAEDGPIYGVAERGPEPLTIHDFREALDAELVAQRCARHTMGGCLVDFGTLELLYEPVNQAASCSTLSSADAADLERRRRRLRLHGH